MVNQNQLSITDLKKHKMELISKLLLTERSTKRVLLEINELLEAVVKDYDHFYPNYLYTLVKKAQERVKNLDKSLSYWQHIGCKGNKGKFDIFYKEKII